MDNNLTEVFTVLLRPPDNDSSNGSVQEHLDEGVGVPVAVEALMYIMYIVISVAAIGGNAIVCYIVFACHRMRSVTNFFIVNLAVGDILMASLCIPFGFVSNLLLQYWPFGAVMCVVVSYAQAVSVFISAYTLVAISFDRYIAILYPLRPRMSKLQAKLIIALIWLVALLTPLPTAALSRLEQPPDWNLTDRYTCMEAWESNTQRYHYSMALMVLQYFFPLAVLIFTYTRIAIEVWGKRAPGEAQDARDQRMAASKRKMVKMMIVCVCVFTLCWLPFNSLMVAGDQHPELYNLPDVIYVWFACHWLAMSHASYNPLIYFWMNDKYRHGFRAVFSFMPCVDASRRRRMDQQSTIHVSMAAIKMTRRVDTSEKNVNSAWQKTKHSTIIIIVILSYRFYCTEMVKMMITVVSVFTLCWLPLNALIVAGDEHDEVWLHPHILHIWFVCHWLAMSSTAYNPLIYCWMNEKYRDGFRHVFRCLLVPATVAGKASFNRSGFNRSGTSNTIYTSIRSSGGFHRGGSQTSSHRGSFAHKQPRTSESKTVHEATGKAASNGFARASTMGSTDV